MNSTETKMSRIRKITRDKSIRKTNVTAKKNDPGKIMGLLGGFILMAMASITVVAAAHIVELPDTTPGAPTFDYLTSGLPAGKTIIRGGDEIVLSKQNYGAVNIHSRIQIHENNNAAGINMSGFADNSVTLVGYSSTSQDRLALKPPEERPYYLVTGSLGYSYYSDYSNYTYFDSTIFVIGVDLKLTYDPNGGEGKTYSELGHGDMTVTKDSFSRQGYDFLGWSTNKTATTAEFVAGNVIKPTDNIIKSQFSVDCRQTTPSADNGYCSFIVKPDNEAELVLYAVWKGNGSAASEVQNSNQAVGNENLEATKDIDPSLKNAKSLKLKAGKKSLTVSWKKLTKKQQKQIAGIEIQYSTDKAFKENVKTVTVSKSKASKKIGKLTPKKKYYVQIRVFKKQGSEKIYSNWSSPKNKKVK